VQTRPGSTYSAAAQRFAPVLALGAFYVFLGIVVRMVLWVRFGTVADVPAADLPFLLLGGVLNDAVESLYLRAVRAVPAPAPGPVASHGDQPRADHGRTAVHDRRAASPAAAETYFFEEFDARSTSSPRPSRVSDRGVRRHLGGLPRWLYVLAVTVLLAAALTWLLWRPVDGRPRGATRFLPPGPFALHATALIAAIVWHPTSAPSWSANRVENEIAERPAASSARR
jgi:hypothetical protein